MNVKKLMLALILIALSTNTAWAQEAAPSTVAEDAISQAMRLEIHDPFELERLRRRAHTMSVLSWTGLAVAAVGLVTFYVDVVASEPRSTFGSSLPFTASAVLLGGGAYYVGAGGYSVIALRAAKRTQQHVPELSTTAGTVGVLTFVLPVPGLAHGAGRAQWRKIDEAEGKVLGQLKRRQPPQFTAAPMFGRDRYGLRLALTF